VTKLDQDDGVEDGPDDAPEDGPENGTKDGSIDGPDGRLQNGQNDGGWVIQ
jgi:hypothetical protein